MKGPITGTCKERLGYRLINFFPLRSKTENIFQLRFAIRTWKTLARKLQLNRIQGGKINNDALEA